MRSIDSEIRASFADVARPRTLARKRRFETDDMDRELGEKPWYQLGVSELMRHRAALGMLDAAAFRYYLPAYLLASLDETQYDLREATLFALSPYLRSRGPDPADESLFQERTAALDEPQRAAIRRFLGHVRPLISRPKAYPALDPGGVWL